MYHPPLFKFTNVCKDFHSSRPCPYAGGMRKLRFFKMIAHLKSFFIRIDLLPGQDHTQNLPSVKVVFSFVSISHLVIYPSRFFLNKNRKSLP